MQSYLISKEEKEKLKSYLPNIEQLLDSGDIDEIQIAIMTAIDKTLDEDNEATAETFELEKIYDNISKRYKQSIASMDSNTLKERLKIEVNEPKYTEKKIEIDDL